MHSSMNWAATIPAWHMRRSFFFSWSGIFYFFFFYFYFPSSFLCSTRIAMPAGAGTYWNWVTKGGIHGRP